MNTSSRDRHMKPQHGNSTTKFKCWICDKLYSRKDILRKQSMGIHEIPEIRFKKISINNANRSIKIEAVKPWTPPWEARTKPTFKLVQRQTMITKKPHFKALTLDQALKAVGHFDTLPSREGTALPDDTTPELLQAAGHLYTLPSWERLALPDDNPPRCTTPELLQDLCLSSSSTALSSTSTICTDEVHNALDITDVHVYGRL